MDFPRNILKALFYEIELDHVANAIVQKYKSDDFLFKKIVEIMSILMPAFTKSELKLLADMEKQKWKKDCDTIGKCVLESLMNAIKELSVNNTSSLLKVQFNNLLRWRETSLFLGEDLLICAILSKNSPQIKNDFSWQEVLTHDNHELNTLLQTNDLCDLHLHFSSSYAAFDLQWIQWMNCKYSGKEDGNESKWIQIAMTIRLKIFSYLECKKADWIGIENILSWEDNMIHTQTTSLYDDINFAILCSQKINNDGDYSYWDYAIRTDISTLNNSPYTLLWGERKLLYSYLFEFNNGKDPNIKKLATAFYMYCIIKINIRKNYILTNKFVGLENFQDHNNKHCDVGDNIKDKYVIQSSLEGNSKIKIEPRFSISFENAEKKMARKSNTNFFMPFFSDNLFANQQTDRIAFTISIPKPKNKSREGWSKNRTETQKTFEIFLHKFYKKADDNQIPIVGVDFAGADWKSRPYFFSPLVRYGRENGFDNFTYHIGEDFYDLIDGLRAVDEVLVFLNWNGHNRLAHLNSLFVDVEKYYETRHWNMIIPQQILLDNLIWIQKWTDKLCVKLEDDVEKLFIQKIEDCFKDLKCEKYLSFESYMGNFEIRGFEDTYLLETVAENYNKLTQITAWHILKSHKFLSLLEKIQTSLLQTIINKNIHIETCPSSNFLIGRFDKYDSVPTANLYKYIDKASISINTDIKGTVATSLVNEYSLMALALEKKGIEKTEIHQYLKKIMNASHTRKFT